MKKPGKVIRVVDLTKACLWLSSQECIDNTPERLDEILWERLCDLDVVGGEGGAYLVWKDYFADCDISERDVDALFRHFGDEDRLYLSGD